MFFGVYNDIIQEGFLDKFKKNKIKETNNSKQSEDYTEDQKTFLKVFKEYCKKYDTKGSQEYKNKDKLINKAVKDNDYDIEYSGDADSVKFSTFKVYKSNNNLNIDFEDIDQEAFFAVDSLLEKCLKDTFKNPAVKNLKTLDISKSGFADDTAGCTVAFK